MFIFFSSYVLKDGDLVVSVEIERGCPEVAKSNDRISLKEKDAFSKLMYHDVISFLNKTRNESVIVEVAVPGQRWGMEFIVEIERFISNGDLLDKQELQSFIENFGD